LKVSSVIVADDEKGRAAAAAVIARGGLIAFRTDTFYGLGADPFNSHAIARLKELKGRDDGKPILVVISDAAIVERFIGRKTEIFDAVSQNHWPGPLTIVLKAKPEVSDELTAGSGTIGLRLPEDEKVRALVRACGGALTATSANLSGEPPARTAAEVKQAFHTGLDLIVDGGTTCVDKPSTVIDLSGAGIRLIREGMVTRDELNQTLNKLKVNSI
jgi:L-threonylcarbamoyladenylate synthase